MQQTPYLSGPRVGSVTLANIFATLGGEDGVTAFATGGQTSATQLLATVSNHRVSVCVTAADSVKLPAATVGQQHFVRNDGATTMQIFGQATETINGVASATGVAHGSGMGVWYVCTTIGQWTTSPVSLIRVGDGTSSLPSYSFGSSPGYGIYLDVGRATVNVTANTTNSLAVSSAGLRVGATRTIAWLTTDPSAGATADTGIARASAGSLLFGDGSTATTTSRTEMNKAVTAFTDAVAKTVFTLTIPNAAHSASYLVRVTGSLGAGGAIGANEASATNCYVVTLTRTAGVAAVAAISAAFGAAACAVAGAATATCTAALAAVGGAVGATNTIDIQATITRSGGSSANHTCVATVSLLNANVTGITVA